MKIPGTGQDLINAFIKAQNKGDSLGTNRDRESISAGLSYYKEALLVDLSFKEGTLVGLEYIYEAMEKKTIYEISAFSNYSYKDDYFSPENTAKRILEYARALWDGSREQFDLLSKAIDKGIDEAKKILGDMPGWLEDIIGATVDLIHEGLDVMEQEIMQSP